MAELHTVGEMAEATVRNAATGEITPEFVRQPGGAGPLWRSLLSPRPGQKALDLGRGGSDLFGFLKKSGVRVERGSDRPLPLGSDGFDLVLEDRTGGGAPFRAGRVRPLLVPGGRWVVALDTKRWVGLESLRILRGARLEGFESVETFYAHPSLRSPRILVPLDRPEPFQYFLQLAVGVRAPRQRLVAFLARFMCVLRLHRMLLPNLIMVARRVR